MQSAIVAKSVNLRLRFNAFCRRFLSTFGIEIARVPYEEDAVVWAEPVKGRSRKPLTLPLVVRLVRPAEPRFSKSPLSGPNTEKPRRSHFFL